MGGRAQRSKYCRLPSAWPGQYGGAAADAFHVVVPALPGFPCAWLPGWLAARHPEHIIGAYVTSKRVPHRRLDQIPRGGHLMASEEPDLLAAGVCKAFRDSLRRVM
jgi:hypothetical protein